MVRTFDLQTSLRARTALQPKRAGLPASCIVNVNLRDQRLFHNAVCRLAAVAAPDVLEEGALCGARLPEPLLRALLRFRRDGSACDALLIRGVGAPRPRRSNEDKDCASCANAARTGETILLPLLLPLGAPIGYSGPTGSRLGKLLPAPVSPHLMEAQSTGRLRTEMAYYPALPDYVAFYCAGDEPVHLRLGSLRRAQGLLPEIARRWLVSSFYEVRLPPGSNARYTQAFAPLEGADGTLRLTLDMARMEALYGDAMEAASTLEAALLRASVCCALAPGDVLILDNRLTAYALLPEDRNAPPGNPGLQQLSVSSVGRRAPLSAC